MAKKKKSPKETFAEKQKRSQEIVKVLKKEFPNSITALHHENAFQLLIATILSAQCTDERVNMVTTELFKKYPDARSLATAHLPDLEQEIRSTGFYKMKSRNIVGCSQGLVERFDGKVPQTLEELITLPGVGRKTANVVLGQVFGIASGVVVDTHVHRLSRRLGFSEDDSAENVEQDLMELFPKRQWILLGTIVILHGRKTCNARKPLCSQCPVVELCPSAGEFLSASK